MSRHFRVGRVAFGVAQDLYFSARARATYDTAAPSRQAEYRDQLAKLRIAPHEGQRRQVDTMDRDKGDCSVFPRGHNSVRIFFYESPDGTLRICEIASPHSDVARARLSPLIRSYSLASRSTRLWPRNRR